MTGPLVRYPRAWLQVGKARLPCLSADVLRRAEGHCDQFGAELSIAQTTLAGFGYPEWADWKAVDVQILMSLAADQSDVKSMVTGRIDTPHIHWSEGTVSISGRDKSATLAEKRRSQAFKNQKTVDVVRTIAADHGLTVAAAETSNMAGKLYDVDTVHHLLNLSDWEAMNHLANREGFRWYVDGTTLYFEPKGTDSSVYNLTWIPPDTQAPFGIATFTDLETHRNMTAAKPHKVAVRSWHHKDKKHYDGTAQADGEGETVEIEHHHNGRNQADVDSISKSRLKDAIRHNCNLVAKAPADLSVTVRQKLQLAGTGTIYDQLYDIDSTHHSISWGEGSEMTLECKIAKAGRSGTDNSGSTKIQPTPKASTDVPLPPERPAGIGVNNSLGQGGIGHA